MGSAMRTPVTVIEFGTDKIRVLHGNGDGEGGALVTSFAEAPSEGSVIKGAIHDPVKAGKILGGVLDRTGNTEAINDDNRMTLFLLNGAVVNSCRGEGSLMLHDGGKVENRHVEDVLTKAHGITLPPGMVSFNSFDGFFVLDRRSRVKYPVGQHANQLDAYLHILTTEQRVLDQIHGIMFNLGFERKGEPLFNGVASAYGVLRKDEREQGALLIDFGHGACDYVLVCTEGIYLSGVLPVGVAHVANDLAIGLDLPYDYCLKFLREGKLKKMRDADTAFLEYVVSVTGKKRRIPLDSFERIIEFRLREIYSVIRAKVQEKNLSSCMTAGVVLCGGGSMIEGSLEMAKDIFSDSAVRIGEPFGVAGVMNGFEMPPPCYASILGALKYAVEELSQQEESGIDVVRNALSRVGENVLSNVRKVFRR
ncbi:MAG: hypothetical protein J6C30_07110 [Lentisphaeria bacterium]|nr:hypothetical protein [Lentisphaeria bacterium]